MYYFFFSLKIGIKKIMEKIYYSPKGFCKGLPAVEKLSKEAKVSKKKALEFFKEAGGVADIFTPTKENNQTKI